MLFLWIYCHWSFSCGFLVYFTNCSVLCKIYFLYDWINNICRFFFSFHLKMSFSNVNVFFFPIALLPPFGLLKYPVRDYRIALYVSNHLNHFQVIIIWLDSSRLPAWGCTLLLQSMGLTYEVRGHNNIDRNKGGVVLINHQSGIDLVGIPKLT